jgi:NTP pyrophosphatase (non-canonical NTP hydrolase)
VKRRARAGVRPPSDGLDLAAFQTRIAATFGAKDAARGLPGTFMYFTEEVGELAEALREPQRHDLPGEFADCLAWLTSLAHLAGVDLAAAAAAKYPAVCRRCGASPCVCTGKP